MILRQTYNFSLELHDNNNEESLGIVPWKESLFKVESMWYPCIISQKAFYTIL